MLCGGWNEEDPSDRDRRREVTVSSAIAGFMAMKRRLSDFDAIVMHLQGRSDILAVRKSNVLQIELFFRRSGLGHQGRWTLTDEYLRQRAERYQSPQAVVFFEQQMSDARRASEKTGAGPGEVRRRGVRSRWLRVWMGRIRLRHKKDLVMQRLSGLESSLGSAEVELESQRRQVASLQAMLRREPERLESSSRTLDATTEEIERALASLKLERDRPPSRFQTGQPARAGHRHPDQDGGGSAPAARGEPRASVVLKPIRCTCNSKAICSRGGGARGYTCTGCLTDGRR